MADGTQGDSHADDTKLHGKPDKTLRFSLCSDNLEGISEGQCAGGVATFFFLTRKEEGDCSLDGDGSILIRTT